MGIKYIFVIVIVIVFKYYFSQVTVLVIRYIIYAFCNSLIMGIWFKETFIKR